jgi:hypothetical protein
MRISRPFRWVFAFFSLFFMQNMVLAQTPTQSVRGRVYDAGTNAPLNNARLTLRTQVVVSDTMGQFMFKDVPVGVYNLEVNAGVGYAIDIHHNIRVETGKEVVLEIPCVAADNQLDGITVKAQRSLKVTNQLVNDLLKFPATFNDPARAISYLAGAAVDNDQANNISVRGNTPSAMQWYLEGAEIVNPNHLSNAGTPSDRSTANGGGVLILGTNLMENASLYKGAMPADMGGSLTGIMDLRLRKGNDRKYQTTLSLGLIGIEAGSEGYFSDKIGQTTGANKNGQRASYLVHYRYSTIGLLSKLGVPLGDEAIAFQDLSYNVNVPTKKIGTFNIFGMHGLSDNVFKHKEFTKWETEKDSQDITYKNFMSAVGLKHQVNLSTKTTWTSVGAYSAYNLDYIKKAYNRKGDLAFPEITFPSDLKKLFFKSQVQTNFSIGTLNVGMATKKEFFLDNPKFKDTWVQPFVEWEGSIHNFTYRLGAREVAWLKTKSRNFEPSAGLQYGLPKGGKIALNYSRQSQSFKNYNIPFQLTKSDNINLDVILNASKSMTYEVGGFYQDILTFGDYSVTQIEELEKPFYLDILHTVKGRNMGIEMSVIHTPISQGYHWRINTTLYDAKIIAAQGTRDSRFNGRYIVNGLVGKEWQYGKIQNKFFGVNLHQILRGGFRETPIIADPNKPTVPFSLQLKDYIRTDISVYWKKSRLKWASTLQLDIQNLTNQQNEAWHYYDTFLKKVETKYQLGIIPNLSYKVEF